MLVLRRRIRAISKFLKCLYFNHREVKSKHLTKKTQSMWSISSSYLQASSTHNTLRTTRYLCRDRDLHQRSNHHKCIKQIKELHLIFLHS